MDKRAEGLAGAMREIAEERDDQLRKAGRIPRDRLQQLQTFLAAEFPLETAFSTAARRRDESLGLPEPALPAVVHATLMRQVELRRAMAKPFDALRHISAWWRALRLTGAYRTAAVAAAAVVLTSAVLHFSRANNLATRISHESLKSPTASPGSAVSFNDNLFERPPDHLTLRVNRLELASLDLSLLTLNRALPDFDQADRILPLDLPLRKIRLNVEAVRTP